MPVDMVLNPTQLGAVASSAEGRSRVVSGGEIREFQNALQKVIPLATTATGVERINDAATTAAAAESMGIGEVDRKKKEESIINKMSARIEESLMEGSNQLQGFYKHMASFKSADQMAQGSTMLSIQLELMRATVLIDIITKVANKAATTIDSMIRLQ